MAKTGPKGPWKDFIGRVYDSNNFGKFKIVREGYGFGYKDKLYQIEFLDTGYQTLATYSAIRHGRVKDQLVPTVAGVGYIGYFFDNITAPWVFPIYRTWNDMLNRCYNKDDNSYFYYGGAGITVEERWLEFAAFFEDSKKLPNYEKKMQYPDIYQIDKDYLQINKDKKEKIYSRDTCMWLSIYDNTIIMNRENTHSKYYGVLFRNGKYHVRINNKDYGRFKSAEAAANLFNYIYPNTLGPFNDIMILNDVEPIPFEELDKYK